MAQTGKVLKKMRDQTELTHRQQVQARANLARKAGNLLDRLYKNSLGQLGTQTVVRRTRGGGSEELEIPVQMSMGQIKSAEIVLKKIIPDLQNFQVEEVKQEPELSRMQLMAKLYGLVSANPEFQKLLPKVISGEVMENGEEKV